MLLQAALNGSRTKNDHAAVPISMAELIHDAIACVHAGAQALHLHVHDHNGKESLEPAIVDAVVREVRHACGVPVGVSTGAWIEPDVERRLALVQAWHEPDYASVNLCEAGAVELILELLQQGIGIEAGIWTADDALQLVASGLGNQMTRILIEVGELQADTDGELALEQVTKIHAILDHANITVPRLQHGDGVLTWPLLIDALKRGLSTRIGLEDTLYLPDGTLTSDNATLVKTAHRMISDHTTSASSLQPKA